MIRIVVNYHLISIGIVLNSLLIVGIVENYLLISIFDALVFVIDARVILRNPGVSPVQRATIGAFGRRV